MASYPSTLPAPLLAGYKFTPSDPTLRTEMEYGTKSRRTTLARQDKFSLPLSFNEAEMAIFKAWFYDPSGADGGNAWFDIALKTGDVAAKQTVSAKFTSVFDLQGFDGKNWSLNMAVQVRYA